MAEITRLLPANTFSLKIADNTGTPITKEVTTLTGPATFPITRPNEKNEALAQNGGTKEIYSVVYNGVTGSMELTYSFWAQDPLNVTAADKAIVDIHRKLHNNTLLTSWVSTNPLTDTQLNMLDFVVLFKRAGGASTDQTATAAGYIKSLTPGWEDGKLKYDVTVGIVEEWTWA